MPVFEFTRWSGRAESVAADEVTFPAGALVFRIRDRIVLAVKPGDWNNLRDIDAEAGLGAPTNPDTQEQP